MSTTQLCRTSDLPGVLGSRRDDPSAKTSESVFTRGIFRPVTDEITAEDLPVVGEIPKDLNGLFVRNGPNPFNATSSTYHWFDGDGMVHGVRFRDGKANYLNRYVQTASLKQQQRDRSNHGISLNDGFFEILRTAFRGFRKGNFDFGNKANTSLVWHHGKLLALWELGSPYELHPSDLRTIGIDALSPDWNSGTTAHPKIDPVTGELLFFGYSVRRPEIEYGVLDSTGKLVHQITIPLRHRIMMHDFAITSGHAVFMDLPMVARFERTLFGKPLFQFRPELGARFGVLPRRGKSTDVRWFDVDPCFVFHVLNAWDDDQTIEVLGCRFESEPAILKSKFLSESDLELGSVLYRWRLDLESGNVNEGPIDDTPAEFPRIDDGLIGQRNRFGYATSFALDSARFLMTDLELGTTICHDLGPGRTAGEGVFVPKQCPKAENDGYLLAFVHNQADVEGEFVILDCQQFDGPPLARVRMPRRVPVGFHGHWIDGANLE